MSLRKAASTALILTSTTLCAQVPPTMQAFFRQKLNAEITLTTVSQDRMTILTPGSVAVLQKDNLEMNAITSPLPALNTFNDRKGKISQGWGGFGVAVLAGTMSGGQAPLQRKAMAGEKLWVVAMVVNDHKIALVLYSEPDENNLRYYGELDFPFHKDGVTEENVMQEIAGVLTIQPPPSPQPDQATSQPAPTPGPALAPLAPPPGAPPAAPSSGLAPLAPPPPPPAAPPTISLGETKDQVVAALGQPAKVVQLGTKEIDVYPDMKITFVNGKVTDVE